MELNFEDKSEVKIKMSKYIQKLIEECKDKDELPKKNAETPTHFFFI